MRRGGVGPAVRPRDGHVASILLPLLLVTLALPATALAQTQEYRLSGPGDSRLVLPRDSVLALLEATRALQRHLEEDPEILYYLGFGPAVPATEPAEALPWNAVEVLTDSTAAIRTPGNLREADRAYQAYAVIRMENIRSDPDVPCDSLVVRELRAAAAFADGWFVARALFGAPPYPPLDELAVARAEGHVAGMMATLGNRQLGGCLERWWVAHPGAVRAYREWRGEASRPAPVAPEPDPAAPEATDGEGAESEVEAGGRVKPAGSEPPAAGSGHDPAAS